MTKAKKKKAASSKKKEKAPEGKQLWELTTEEQLSALGSGCMNNAIAVRENREAIEQNKIDIYCTCFLIILFAFVFVFTWPVARE